MRDTTAEINISRVIDSIYSTLTELLLVMRLNAVGYINIAVITIQFHTDIGCVHHVTKVQNIKLCY